MKIPITFPTRGDYSFTFMLSEAQAWEILEANVNDKIFIDGSEEVVTVGEDFIEHFKVVNSGTSLETLESDSVFRILKQNLQCDAWED